MYDIFVLFYLLFSLSRIFRRCIILFFLVFCIVWLYRPFVDLIYFSTLFHRVLPPIIPVGGFFLLVLLYFTFIVLFLYIFFLYMYSNYKYSVYIFFFTCIPYIAIKYFLELVLTLTYSQF